MKTVISFFLILSFSNALACKLKQSYSYTSLSGPITMLLEELDLLEDKSLKAISKFHPVKKTVKIKQLAGGLFLSSRAMKDLEGQIVFVDSSRELEENLKKFEIKKIEVVITVGLDVISVIEKNIDQLKPYLEKCGTKISAIQEKITALKKGLKKLKRPKGTYLFYLGEITQSNMPNMLMVADGPVLTLKNGGVRSYPSELSYVTWSEKVLKSLPTPVVHYGLMDSKSEKVEILKISENKFNLSLRGVMIPGISQFKLVEGLLAQVFL